MVQSVQQDGSAAMEADLGRRAAAGDRAAYGRLVLLCQDRLYNAVLRMVGDVDEARELTQETFLRGLMKIDSFRSDAAPYTWLFRIAMNLTISQLRSVRRRRTFTVGDNGRAEDDQAAGLDRLRSARADDPAALAESRERQQRVLDALGCLDIEQRALLVMRDIDGMDYQQMADVLQLPLGTLKSRLFRARMALREELTEVQ